MAMPNLRTTLVAAAVGLSAVFVSGCTTTPKEAAPTGAAARSTLNREVDATLARLYKVVPGSEEMVQRSAGVMVFPAVVGGSFVVGLEQGQGALREGAKSVAYYKATAGSIGLQAGGQSKAVVVVFNTSDALNSFKAKKEAWTAGADATVAVGKVGANGMVTPETAQQPIASFVLTNVGLEAGASIGTVKIERIEF